MSIEPKADGITDDTQAIKDQMFTWSIPQNPATWGVAGFREPASFDQWFAPIERWIEERMK